MVEINRLKKNYGTTMATDIEEFTIADGELLGLVGNNGAGKTTLLRLMLDLTKPDSGHVTLNGINPTTSEQWKDFTAAYLDEAFLIDFLSPKEYFSFIARVSKVPPQQVEQLKKDFSTFLGSEIMGQEKLIRQLSAGNRQKVGIAAALLTKPQLLLLDEPFNFLDPTSQAQLAKLLTDYRQQTGATIIVSSHNLAHTIDISTSIALMEHGRIIRHLPGGATAAEELDEYFR